jgi:hypothetical protein
MRTRLLAKEEIAIVEEKEGMGSQAKQSSFANKRGDDESITQKICEAC